MPYVIVAGTPDEAIYQLVRQPLELVKNPSLKLNANYYIERVIGPALNRVFKMIGYDTIKWFKDMPRKLAVQRSHFIHAQKRGNRKQQTTISQYFTSGECPVCKKRSNSGDMCEECVTDVQRSSTNLIGQLERIENKLTTIKNICLRCMGSRQLFTSDACTSIDCPILFRLSQANLDAEKIAFIQDQLRRLEF